MLWPLPKLDRNAIITIHAKTSISDHEGSLFREPTSGFWLFEELARKCLLPPTKLSFWIEYLQQLQK